MRVIEKKVGDSVSPEMLQEAKNLRNLATLIEGGNAIAVAYSWVAKDNNGVDLNTGNTFCADHGKYTLLGVVTALQVALASGINDA